MRCPTARAAANQAAPGRPIRPGRPFGRGLVGCCLLLAACGDPTETNPAAPPLGSAVAATAALPNPAPSLAATPQATPPTGYRSGAVATGEVVWALGTDPATGAPVEPVRHFKPDDPTIVAAVPIERAPAGTRLRADWHYNDTPLAGLSSEITVDGDGAARWVAFAITLPDGEPWPTGSYDIAVTVDDRAALRSRVEVVDADVDPEGGG